MDAVLDEAVLPPLLHRFYERVRHDAELGPVFNGAVQDWPAHLQRIADFWSSVMLTSGRYKGNPMAQHLRHADALTSSMFERWLELWRQTTDELLAPPMATAMQAKAARIAESLQLALRLRTPEGRSDLLRPRSTTVEADPLSQPYRSTPVFDEATLPKALQKEHATKAGAWAVIRVLEGCVRYCIEDGSPCQLLTPDTPGLARPQELHHVEPIGPMRMRIDFYDHEPRLA